MLLWVLLPVVVLVVSWAVIPLEPGVGIDQSWVISLYLVAEHHLHYGTQAVFTYGPLGFLTIPEAVELHLTQWAILYELVIRAAVAIVIFGGARRLFGTVIGAIAAIVLIDASVSLAQTGELVLIFTLATWAVRAELSDPGAAATAAIVGAFAGLQALVKVSFGPEFLLIGVVMALSFRARRGAMVAIVVGGFVVSLLAFWLASGQSLATLPQFAANGLQAVSGYGDALQAATPGLGWEYTPALLMLAFGLWAAWATTMGRSPRGRFGTGALWAVFWFSAWKEGFVRQDLGHTLYFFIAVMLGSLAFQWRRDLRVPAIAGIAGMLICVLAAQTQSLTGDIHPDRSLSSFARQTAEIVDTSSMRSIQAQGIATVRSEDALDPEALRLLGSHTMSVYPIEQAQAWGWGLNWVPFPVFQSYAAYTSKLDGLDAGFLASARAPQRILYEGTPGIDDRVGAFDEAQTLRMMFCRYQMIYHTPTYAVLALGRNRCVGQPHRLKVVHAAWGQSVGVPEPPADGWMVYARISGAAPHGLDSLVSLLYRAPLRYVSLNGTPGARLITGTSQDGLILRMSPGTDYPSPLSLEQGSDSIAVDGGSKSHGGALSLRFAFYAQRVIGSPTARG